MTTRYKSDLRRCPILSAHASCPICLGPILELADSDVLEMHSADRVALYLCMMNVSLQGISPRLSCPFFNGRHGSTRCLLWSR
jgi:hypothetical protein